MTETNLATRAKSVADEYEAAAEEFGAARGQSERAAARRRWDAAKAAMDRLPPISYYLLADADATLEDAREWLASRAEAPEVQERIEAMQRRLRAV